MDGMHGPIWVQDLQGRVLTETVLMGVLLRVARVWLHVKSQERMWAYCFVLAFGVTLLTFFEMGMSLALHNLRGILEATAALTMGTVGLSSGIDLGAKRVGLDMTRLDASKRQSGKVRL